MEMRGPDDSDEENALLNDLEEALTRLMSYSHKSNVMLTGFVFQAKGVSIDDSKPVLSAGSMKNQIASDSLGLIEVLRENTRRRIFRRRD